MDIKTSGAYKYAASPDFEILMVAYAFDDGPKHIVDLASGEELPVEFIEALSDPTIEEHAHNANFERVCFKAIGIDIPITQWHCSAVKALNCGLPASLGEVSKALDLQEKGKLKTGNALIRYFSCPVKPTKANGGRTRNLPHHNPEKWEEYKSYCINDVEAEREVDRLLGRYIIPNTERELYILDQKINDRGVSIDTDLAKAAIQIDTIKAAEIKDKMIELTGLQNPNSPMQLKKWLSERLSFEVTTLAKEEIPKLLKNAKGKAKEVLELRQKAAKTSIKKYAAMLACAGEDNKARGILQFYGAGRTGRWAGRLIQPQNMPRTYIDLYTARGLIRTGNSEIASMVYDNVPDILSQLTRMAIVPSKGNSFIVADFSAIEARVISWLANEKWRMDVFNGDGKIYEASASAMFGVPIKEVTKESDLRAKGKISELALGYGGSVGALIRMGGEEMGLNESEMQGLVNSWRHSNPRIVALWKSLNSYAMWAVRNKGESIKLKSAKGGLVFHYDGTALTIQLPSGRKLFYWEPTFGINRFDSTTLKYKGVNGVTRKWEDIETYGGKLAENITQAIARDLLADAMLRLDKEKFDIRMHVHDEVIAETSTGLGVYELDHMCTIMGEEVAWAKGLPLKATGYVSQFYKKD